MKTKIKSVLILLLCGIVYFTFAVGSGSDKKKNEGNTTNTATNTSNATSTNSDTSKVARETSATKYKLNEDIMLKTNDGEYRVKFTKVTETNDRNEYTAKEAKRVVVVEYEYENISMTKDLYVSKMNFKLYDKNNTEMQSYPMSRVTKIADSIGTGKKAVASEAYALNNDKNYIELDLFPDIMSRSKANCTVILEW